MKQNEIWLIDLEPTIGAEMKKKRPAIIVNHNGLGKLPLKVIVPITDWKDKYNIAPWMVKLTPDDNNGLSKISAADCLQLRAISQERLSAKIGEIDSVTQNEIKSALNKVLDL